SPAGPGVAEPAGLEDSPRGVPGSRCGVRRDAPDYHSVAFRSLLGRFIDVCNAIAYAHSRSVLHRDLKPSNIMLGEFGETLVVDWGLAKVLDDPAANGAADRAVSAATPELTQLPVPPSASVGRLPQPAASGPYDTAAGTAVGTAAYMS